MSLTLTADNNECVTLVSRTVHSTEDVNRDCVHYPTREHRTYADCDQDFVKKTLPEDLVPFWNVDNISSASSFWNDKDSKKYRKAVDSQHLLLYSGKLSSCKVRYQDLTSIIKGK